MKNNIITSILLLVFLFPGPVFCDEDVLRPYGRPGLPKIPLSFGIEAGVNFNSVNNYLTWQPGFIRSPQNALNNGNGISPFVNLFIDIPVSKTMGIELNAGYDSKSFDNSEMSVMDYDVLNDRLVVSNNLVAKPVAVNGSLTIKSDVSYSYKSSLSFITFAPFFYYNIFPGVKLFAGPAFQFPIGESKTEKSFTIINSFFTGGRKNVNIIENTPMKIRAGIEFGISYDIHISKKLTVSPIARYQLMLTQYQSDYLATDPPVGIDADARAVMIVEPESLNSLRVGIRLKMIL